MSTKQFLILIAAGSLAYSFAAGQAMADDQYNGRDPSGQSFGGRGGSFKTSFRSTTNDKGGGMRGEYDRPDPSRRGPGGTLGGGV